MKILLVGNYPPDRQHSMQRFALMMRHGLRARGHGVRLIRPRPICSRQAGRAASSVTQTTARKWLAYVDKYILFPRILRRALRAFDVVHVCDHSNAMYVEHCAGIPHVVTCHDLLAVRGALGEKTDCPATWTGKFLQRWILRSLKRAQMVACVSSATREDLLRLAGPALEARSCVILLGVPPTMSRLAPGEAAQRLAALPVLNRNRPFLLNVGSSLRRKNRDGALRIYKKISEHLDCDLVFAGEPLCEELKEVKQRIGLNGGVIEVPHPSDDLLEALYSGAFALLYPTKFEGFGWPAIEAQACGCPVVSSSATSLPEVVGDSALLRVPEDEDGFAADVLQLMDAATRRRLIERGFENVKRFTPERMVNDYLELYQKICLRDSN